MRVGINLTEVFSASTLGAILGLFTFGTRERWVRLGRDAYIAHDAQMFDKLAARPPHLIITIIAGTVTALIFLALFKGLAFFYEFVSNPLLARKRVTVPPAKLLIDRSRPE
jgi:hypothetical protein